MKELVFRAKCDRCSVETIYPLDTPDESELSLDVTLTVGDKSVVLDLCKVHRDELDELVQEFVLAGRPPELGADAPRPKRKRPSLGSAPAAPGYETDPQAPFTVNADGSFQCPNCPTSSPSPQGLGAHRRQHGYIGTKSSRKRQSP